MPRIKAAKKALRQTIKRTASNRVFKVALKKAIRNSTAAKLPEVQALIDKAAKRGVIHANKAARLKARLMKKFSTNLPAGPLRSEASKAGKKSNT